MNFISRHYCKTISKQLSGAEKYRSHIFNQSLFDNLPELSLHLQKNIIYNKDGLLIINKPYALKKETPKEKGFWQKQINVVKTPLVETLDHLSFCDAIPYLSTDLKMPNLKLMKLPERFISGVSILYNDDVWKTRFYKALGNSLIPLFTYLAVCVGIPIKLNDHVKLGLTLKEHGKIKKGVFLENYSKRSMLKGVVVPIVMNHQTLDINNELNVSLVQIQNNRNKWNALRAYFSQRLLTPILGDCIYGSCVKFINNKPVPIDPCSPMANYPSKLPENILSALEIRRREQSIVPTHLHLAVVDFKKLGKESKTFVAKPSDHFLWTCERLNLAIPEFYLRNCEISAVEKVQMPEGKFSKIKEESEEAVNINNSFSY